MKYLIALCAALSACGGGGGSSPAPPVALTIKPVLVYAEGDSTMCGYAGGICPNDGSAPAVLQALLQEELGPTVTVQNNGVNGSTINQELNGAKLLPLAARLATSTAGTVLENFALNDAVRSTPAQFRIDLNVWIDTVRALGKVPVLEEPNPVTFMSPVLDAFVAIIDDVAAQRGVVLVKQYEYIRSLPNWQSMMVDKVHPSARLYAIKAQREFDVLLPIIRSQQ